MKAGMRARIVARKQQPVTHTNKVMTWCMGQCNKPTAHTETIVAHAGLGFMGQRTCDTCGHNKDIGK